MQLENSTRNVSIVGSGFHGFFIIETSRLVKHGRFKHVDKKSVPPHIIANLSPIFCGPSGAANALEREEVTDRDQAHHKSHPLLSRNNVGNRVFPCDSCEDNGRDSLLIASLSQRPFRARPRPASRLSRH